MLIKAGSQSLVITDMRNIADFRRYMSAERKNVIKPVKALWEKQKEVVNIGMADRMIQSNGVPPELLDSWRDMIIEFVEKDLAGRFEAHETPSPRGRLAVADVADAAERAGGAERHAEEVAPQRAEDGVVDLQAFRLPRADVVRPDGARRVAIERHRCHVPAELRDGQLHLFAGDDPRGLVRDGPELRFHPAISFRRWRARPCRKSRAGQVPPLNDSQNASSGFRTHYARRKRRR